MNSTLQETSVQRTIREHEDLRRRMAKIKTQAEAASSGSERGAPGFPVGRLVSALDELQSLLAAHFTFEEETGLPEDLALKLPHVSEKAHALRREHVQILDGLKVLAEQGRGTSASGAAEIARFGDRVLDLIAEISRHEENETSLIQDAYLDDLGTAG